MADEISKTDLTQLKNDIVKHLDITVLPIQKQVDKNQKSVEDLYQKNTDTQVALAAIPGAIEAVDIKHDGQHEVIKSSAKTAYMVIGVVIGLCTLLVGILAIVL